MGKLDEKGAALNRLGFIIAVFYWWMNCLVQAHVGSPDVFYDGPVGVYTARITIRMPSVVPGRAEISVRVLGDQPDQVSFLPLFSRTSITNAPPADLGRLIAGETNLYFGELWLMSIGAYTIDVKMRGSLGIGSIQIPVSSVPLSQLPLPPFLGYILVALGALLCGGGVAIVSAAARESVLGSTAVIGQKERRRGWVAGLITAFIMVVFLIGGRRWWNADEAKFRSQLRGGAWPDMQAVVRVDGAQRILRLTLGQEIFLGNATLPLIPDHGKLLHLFLIREGTQDTFAHLHPVRKGGKVFEVALPTLPQGRYKVLCDLTVEGSVLSSTATNSVDVPALSNQPVQGTVLKPDPDDSWANYTGIPVPDGSANNTTFRLPDGITVEWSKHAPLQVSKDAGLNFVIRNASGKPVELVPYMGMLCHAAILRADGSVFSHLHPSGNYSMAAQSFFDAKLDKETQHQTPVISGLVDHSKMDHSKMNHGGDTTKPAIGVSSISLPYEFPIAGDYRIWVQFKIGTQVHTAIFDTKVGTAE